MFARFIYVRYADGLVQQGVRQSGALSLVEIIETWLSLVESFIELKYFHGVAMPALLIRESLMP